LSGKTKIKKTKNPKPLKGCKLLPPPIQSTSK